MIIELPPPLCRGVGNCRTLFYPSFTITGRYTPNLGGGSGVTVGVPTVGVAVGVGVSGVGVGVTGVGVNVPGAGVGVSGVGVNVGVGVSGVGVGVSGVGVGVGGSGSTNSTAPISQAGPCGRRIPR